MKGLAKRENEDSLWAGDSVFVVADGSGGTLRGRRASSMAASGVGETLSIALTGTPLRDPADSIARSIIDVNTKIYEEGYNNLELRGMGTTITVVLIKDGVLYGGYVGDSPVYLVRGGRIKLLTPPHKGSDGEEELYIGRRISMEVRTFSEQLQAGDVVLMCTDGVSDYKSANKLLAQTVKHRDVQRLCDALVEEESEDDATIITLRIEESDVARIQTLPSFEKAGGEIQNGNLGLVESPPEEPRPGRTSPDASDSRSSDLSQSHDVSWVYPLTFILLLGLVVLGLIAILLQRSGWEALREFVSPIPVELREQILQVEGRISRNPLDTSAHNRLGGLHYKAGLYSRGAREFEASLRIDPSNIEALFGLAYGYYNMGKSNEALKVYERILMLNPNDEIAKNNIDFIRLHSTPKRGEEGGE
ncbi:MAG: protein phosphatase 2C domain-containing protein [bacterium]